MSVTSAGQNAGIGGIGGVGGDPTYSDVITSSSPGPIRADGTQDIFHTVNRTYDMFGQGGDGGTGGQGGSATSTVENTNLSGGEGDDNLTLTADATGGAGGRGNSGGLDGSRGYNYTYGQSSEYSTTIPYTIIHTYLITTFLSPGFLTAGQSGAGGDGDAATDVIQDNSLS